MRTKFTLLVATLVVSSLAVGSLAHASPPANADHLKCFKIRDSLVERRTIYLADLFPNSPFEERLDCRLSLPARHFCVNVEKQNVVATDPDFEVVPVPAEPARDYLCYGVKCDRDRPDLEALDQFGARPLRVKRSDFLCMPANKILTPTSPTPPPSVTPTPTETPTPNPTETPLPNPCRLWLNDGRFVDGETCAGDCPPGDICVFTGATSGDGCECVGQDAGCAEDPNNPPITGQCGGLCPSPSDVCLDIGTPGAAEQTLLANCQCLTVVHLGCQLLGDPTQTGGDPVCGGPCDTGSVCAFTQTGIDDGCACVPESATCDDLSGTGIGTCSGFCFGPNQFCNEDLARGSDFCTCRTVQ